MTTYTNRAGQEITEHEWEVLTSMSSYRNLYGNPLIAFWMRTETRWVGYSVEGMMQPGDIYVTMTFLEGETERLIEDFTTSYATEAEAMLGHLVMCARVLEYNGLATKHAGIGR